MIYMRLSGSGKGLIGVDVTSSTVKLIELRRVGSRFQVESYAIAPLREGAVAECRIRDMNEVVETLKRLIGHAKPSVTRAVVAVPTNALITKTLSLPLSLDDDDIEARITLDSDKHTPFPFNDVAFDFQRLGINERHPDRQDVLLVACRQHDVLNLTEAVAQAGLTPVAVDAEAFAIERAFSELNQSLPIYGQSGQGKGVALVDVGANMNSFCVIGNGRIVFSRNMAPGGRTLIDEIRDRYGLSLDEAGLASRRGSLPEDYQRSVLAPFLEMLVKLIGRSLQLYYTSGRRFDVSRMVLAGSASRLPGLAERLAEECGMEVAIADPLHRMRVSSRLDARQLANDAPALLTACGLAMRGVA